MTNKCFICNSIMKIKDYNYSKGIRFCCSKECARTIALTDELDIISSNLNIICNKIGLR